MLLHYITIIPAVLVADRGETADFATLKIGRLNRNQNLNKMKGKTPKKGKNVDKK